MYLIFLGQGLTSSESIKSDTCTSVMARTLRVSANCLHIWSDPEISQTFSIKCIWWELQIVSLQPRKHHLQSVKCKLLCWSKDQKIVKITQQTGKVLVTKNGHHPHECSGAVCEALGHAIVFVESKWWRECGILFVFQIGRASCRERV